LVLVCDHRGEHLAQRFQALAQGVSAPSHLSSHLPANLSAHVQAATCAGSAGAGSGREETTLCIEVSQHLQHSLARLATLRPDAIVLDPLVRGSSVELEAIAGVAGASTPLLLVIEPETPLPALMSALALRARAWDLVGCAAGAEEYALRVHKLLQQGRDLEAMCAWREQARHDDRSGLLRPQAFDENLQQHYSAAQRHGIDLTLVLLDLDRFGEVNKLHDHTIGDEVIARVGRAIRDGLRQEDCAGRLGGDEFGLLLPYTRSAEAIRVVQRLRERLQRLTLPTEMGDRRVCASAGFETFDGKDLEDAKSLRTHAERALRSAKLRGGDCLVYFRTLRQVGGGEHGIEPVALPS
jgi:diguanylate cyclase (GGDEF)-like protein